MSSAPTPPRPYARSVGTVGMSFIAVNSMIGAGIFGLPEILHAAVGTFAPWLVLIGAALVACIAICFAALTRLSDRSGGPQRYVTDAFGQWPGFQVGWLFYFARMLAQAANVTVMLAYAAAILPGLGGEAARMAAITVIVLAVTALNVVGLKRAVSVLGLITLLKLVPLFLLVAVAVLAGTDASPVALPHFSAVEGVALSALYAFVGFENATVPASEARQPRKSLSSAILISLAVVALIYFALQYVYSASSVAGSGSDAPLAALAGLYGGTFGSVLMAATVTVSVLGNMIAGHTTGSRVTSAMADDRLIPGWFGRVSRWGTPANSIAFFGLGALLFALSGTFVTLAVSGTLARLIVYTLSILALPRLRRREGLPAGSWALWPAGAVALLLCGWAALQSSREQWLLIGAFLAVGVLLFWLARAARREARAHVA